MLVNRASLGKKCRNIFVVLSLSLGMFMLGRYTRSYMKRFPGVTGFPDQGVSGILRSGVAMDTGTDMPDEDGMTEETVGEDTINQIEAHYDPEQTVEVIKTLKPVPWEYDNRYKNPCWLDDTGVLQCLPYFYIPGLVDAGTTYLFRAIMHHPQAAFPGFEEANFFQTKDLADLEDGDIYEYVRMYSNATRLIQDHSTSQVDRVEYNKIITGDASSYMNEWWNTTHGVRQEIDQHYTILQYIAHLVPQARFIVVFRNPVERLYSEYCRRTVWKKDPEWPSPDHFHEKALRAITVYNMLFRHTSLKKCVYGKEVLNITEFGLLFGMHYFYWNELLGIFPREQILVVQFHKLFKEDTIKQIFDFLGMSPPSTEVLYKIRLLRWNGHGGATTYGHCGDRRMLFRTRVLLQDFYAPYNEIMADLAKDEDFLYPIKSE